MLRLCRLWLVYRRVLAWEPPRGFSRVIGLYPVEGRVAVTLTPLCGCPPGLVVFFAGSCRAKVHAALDTALVAMRDRTAGSCGGGAREVLIRGFDPAAN